MKQLLKRSIRKFFDFGNEKLDQHFYAIGHHLSMVENKLSQIEQKRLTLFYKNLLDDKKKLPSIMDVGFRNFSQSDEDGILLYIFSILGTTNKLCLDIAFEMPSGSNTANLICDMGWNGLLICASSQERKNAEDFFSRHPDTCLCPPKLINQWVTVENVNDILHSNGICGEIDFFSLDIDGVDYWIWKAMNVVQPRVVVVEFNNCFDSSQAVTIPYSKDFNRFNIHPEFYGASLAAFVKLAAEKGYRLVGCNKYVYNAFFIKNGSGEKELPTVSAQECLDSFKLPTWAEKSIVGKAKLNEIKDLGWQEV